MAIPKINDVDQVKNDNGPNGGVTAIAKRCQLAVTILDAHAHEDGHFPRKRTLRSVMPGTAFEAAARHASCGMLLKTYWS